MQRLLLFTSPYGLQDEPWIRQNQFSVVFHTSETSMKSCSPRIFYYPVPHIKIWYLIGLFPILIITL